MKKPSKEKFVRAFLPTIIWAIFIGTTYAALGRHHLTAIVVSVVMATSVTFVILSERQAGDKNKVSISLVVMWMIALLFIVGINIGGANPVIGLGIWFLHGIAGFTILQFSKNS